MAKPNIEIKIPTVNKVFHCRHDGHFLSGYSVVVARSKGHAKELLVSRLAEYGLKATSEDLELFEIDLTERKAIVLWDGNY